MNNWMVVYATDKSKGAAFASLIDPAPEGAKTFDYGNACYSAGTTFSGDFPPVPSTAPIAWVTGVRVSDATAAMAAEYNSAGPYPLLNAQGVSDEAIASFKEDIFVECAPYATSSNRIPQLLAERGVVRP